MNLVQPKYEQRVLGCVIIMNKTKTPSSLSRAKSSSWSVVLKNVPVLNPKFI